MKPNTTVASKRSSIKFGGQTLLGYVSDENYCALSAVALEFSQNGQCLAVVHSSPRGEIFADLPAANYLVTLVKDGFGSKSVTIDLDPHHPIQFRLLSDNPYGYVWPKWAKSGEKGEFRIHASEPYHLSLWRYGLKKELVRQIGWFDEHGPRANLQLLPDRDFTQEGVGWNRHGYSKHFTADGQCKIHGRDLSRCTPQCFFPAHQIPASEKSGLYYFHVEMESGKFLSFPWVVAPAKPKSSIAVLASTNTWNAYNNFGGRSNYINPTRLPETPTINTRQDLKRFTETASVWTPRDDQYTPLSFDRPEPFNHIPRETQITDPIAGRQPCHLAPAEWRLLGWLEREKFAYDFYSDFQLHTGELDLSAYQILIISTHPEYWSKDAYLRVKKWVFERGGRLMYLGGNGIDCEVELTDDFKMRCKTWLAQPPGRTMIDSDTGKEYDCRFHHKVESPAELLGVVFTEPGAATSAPYRALEPSHWIFSGTSLKRGDIFGANSLHERCPGGASGHETDKRTPHSPANCVLLARGMNIDDGGAEIILHEPPGGGAVFSVGSITWPASILVDPAVSRMTKNVINRFLKKSPRAKKPSK